jgi:hypothetical protein
MKMIEIGQNKTEFSDVCRCQITTYDKQSEVPRGALSAAESSGTPTFGYQTPVQYRWKWILYKLTLVPQSGWPHPVFPLRRLPDRRFPAGVQVGDLSFGRRGAKVRRPCHNLVRDCENSGKPFSSCS